jgi:hypothetical protein
LNCEKILQSWFNIWKNSYDVYFEFFYSHNLGFVRNLVLVYRPTLLWCWIFKVYKK